RRWRRDDVRTRRAGKFFEHRTCAVPLLSLKYDEKMDPSATAEAPAATDLRNRQDIPARFKWNLTHIFADWNAWQQAYDDLDGKIARFAALRGTLSGGGGELLTALQLR